MIWLHKSRANADALERLKPTQEDGHLPKKPRIIGLEFAVLAVRGDREGAATGLAASLDINLSLGRSMIR